MERLIAAVEVMRTALGNLSVPHFQLSGLACMSIAKGTLAEADAILEGKK
jgi:hypothetical protein